MASTSSSRRPAAGAILAPESSTTTTTTITTTPWGLLCLVLLLFGVSFGCNDGHHNAAFQFFPVAPLASSAATDALTLVSGRTQFLGGSAANDAVGYRPSTHHTQQQQQQLRHDHAAAMVVQPPIDSPGLIVGNDSSANKVGFWQTREFLSRPLDYDAPPSRSHGVSDLYRSVAAETTKLTGMPTDDRTKSRRFKPLLESSPSTDL